MSKSTREQLSTVEDLSTVFRHVGKVVEPSVVNIQVHKTVKESRSRMMPDSDQLRRFFREHGFDAPNFDLPNDNNGSEQGLEEVGTGSGVIMDVEDGYGYILTNNHVAGDDSEDGQSPSPMAVSSASDCKLLGADPKSDLAVVQIKADRLIPANWGNSDELEKGDWVMAFGSPFGYVGSMTHGIVSALQPPSRHPRTNRTMRTSSRWMRRSIPATAVGRWSIFMARSSASTPPSPQSAAGSRESDSRFPPTKPK